MHWHIATSNLLGLSLPPSFLKIQVIACLGFKKLIALGTEGLFQLCHFGPSAGAEHDGTEVQPIGSLSQLAD